MSKRSQQRRHRTCNHTLKQRYPNKQTAQRILLKAKIRRALHNNNNRREERAYPCQHCNGWHLTSNP